MADRASRQLPARARHGARVLVVLLGLVLALAVPAAVMAATNEATPAPVASTNPGEGGTGAGGTSWITETPTPAESLVPVALGGVVLVILVVLIAMTSANPSET